MNINALSMLMPTSEGVTPKQGGKNATGIQLIDFFSFLKSSTITKNGTVKNGIIGEKLPFPLLMKEGHLFANPVKTMPIVPMNQLVDTPFVLTKHEPVNQQSSELFPQKWPNTTSIKDLTPILERIYSGRPLVVQDEKSSDVFIVNANELNAVAQKSGWELKELTIKPLKEMKEDEMVTLPLQPTVLFIEWDNHFVFLNKTESITKEPLTISHQPPSISPRVSEGKEWQQIAALQKLTEQLDKLTATTGATTPPKTDSALPTKPIEKPIVIHLNPTEKEPQSTSSPLENQKVNSDLPPSDAVMVTHGKAPSVRENPIAEIKLPLLHQQELKPALSETFRSVFDIKYTQTHNRVFLNVQPPSVDNPIQITVERNEQGVSAHFKVQDEKSMTYVERVMEQMRDEMKERNMEFNYKIEREEKREDQQERQKQHAFHQYEESEVNDEGSFEKWVKEQEE